jgi:hypothetical protein
VRRGKVFHLSSLSNGNTRRAKRSGRRIVVGVNSNVYTMIYVIDDSGICWEDLRHSKKDEEGRISYRESFYFLKKLRREVCIRDEI